jgi:hypothetical protein
MQSNCDGIEKLFIKISAEGREHDYVKVGDLHSGVTIPNIFGAAAELHLKFLDEREHAIELEADRELEEFKKKYEALPVLLDPEIGVKSRIVDRCGLSLVVETYNGARKRFDFESKKQEIELTKALAKGKGIAR